MSKNHRITSLEARFDTHDAVCTERAGNVNDKLEDVKKMITASNAEMHARVTALSARMWLLLFSSLGGTVIALGALVFYLLTSRN